MDVMERAALENFLDFQRTSIEELPNVDIGLLPSWQAVLTDAVLMLESFHMKGHSGWATASALIS